MLQVLTEQDHEAARAQHAVDGVVEGIRALEANPLMTADPRPERDQRDRAVEKLKGTPLARVGRDAVRRLAGTDAVVPVADERGSDHDRDEQRIAQLNHAAEYKAAAAGGAMKSRCLRAADYRRALRACSAICRSSSSRSRCKVSSSTIRPSNMWILRSA